MFNQKNMNLAIKKQDKEHTKELEKYDKEQEERRELLDKWAKSNGWIVQPILINMKNHNSIFWEAKIAIVEMTKDEKKKAK